MRIKHFSSLKTTKEFKAVYENSKIVHTSSFVLFYQACKGKYRVGIVASKKVGKAVSRNRAKRLLRANFIDQIDKLKEGQYILVAKPPLINDEYKKTSKRFFNALKRVKALKQ